MEQLIFGTKEQIQFDNNSEFFEALGFLSKNDGTTSIHWENNEDQGAWGSEGRIHCYKNINSFPTYFSNAFTAGTGNILYRINCNDYIKYIVNKYKFQFGRVQDRDIIVACIPTEYMDDFNRGLNI